MAKTSTAQSLKAALCSWRLGAIALLSLSSGLPLGLVIYAIPAWMAMVGVNIKIIGLVTLAQAPYAFKFLWSPLMDRYVPPWLGRKKWGPQRAWVLVGQLALAALTFALGSRAANPQVGVVAALALLIAFASASQDIAIDAYAVVSLRPHEQGLAVGARTAVYRLGVWIAGSAAITLAAGDDKARIPGIGWKLTLVLLALLFVALAPVTASAPDSEVVPPPRSMREALWEPFVGFFQRNRALEIAGFLLCYRLADNLAVSLVRPFLVQAGFDAVDVGLASGGVSLIFVMVGTFAGGVLTTRLGLVRALWLFGVVQSFGGAGYAAVAAVGPSRPLMYAAMALEGLASGMGNGAFGVLLLRLTQKRYSATQYALFSSVFALGRTLAGPVAGLLVDAVGWRNFFLSTIACGAPGLLMLQRFAPWGSSELRTETEAIAASHRAPLSRAGLAVRGLLAALVGIATALSAQAGLWRLKASKGELPDRNGVWVARSGAVVFGLLVGVGAAAYLGARRSARRASEPEPQTGIEG